MKNLENKIIASIQEKTHGAGEVPGLGIGDDAAYLMTSSMEHNRLVVAADSIVEGIHFRSDWCGWDDVAAKLFEVNASDLLVKGAKPAWALLVMNITAEFAENKNAQDIFVNSLAEKMRLRNTALIGGDLTRSTINTFTLTMMASSQKFIPRQAEQILPGDIIVMAGEAGASSLALRYLYNDLDAKNNGLIDSGIYKELIDKYRRPTAYWDNDYLFELSAKASIDQSDSVLESLQILAEQNNAQFEIDLQSIPLSPLTGNNSIDLSDKQKDELRLSASEDLAQISILPSFTASKLKEFSLVQIGEVTSTQTKSGLQFSGLSDKSWDPHSVNLFRHF